MSSRNRPCESRKGLALLLLGTPIFIAGITAFTLLGYKLNASRAVLAILGMIGYGVAIAIMYVLAIYVDKNDYKWKAKEDAKRARSTKKENPYIKKAQNQSQNPK